MTLRFLILAMVCVMLCACSKPNKRGDTLTTTLESYAAVVRWGNFEDAAAFVDPEVLKTHPVTQLDLDRYAQMRVTGYNDQPARPIKDGEVSQTVEITFANNNTQTVRSIIDRQHWRYDEKAKRWWLMSGLPDITQH